MTELVECVPNFSAGQDRHVVDAIVAAIAGVSGVDVLDVDIGASVNRTVVTFVGAPEAALIAAYEGIATAVRDIDMHCHGGVHPRQGAADVCPFVPLTGLTPKGVTGVPMAECVELARRLSRRLGDELGLTVYLYGEAATRPERRRLADVRRGGYETLEKRLADPAWYPDYGPSSFDGRSGATAVGARETLVAYNVNLATDDLAVARWIARRVRETSPGRRRKSVNGQLEQADDAAGLPCCLARAWRIEEYGRAQVTMNLTDYRVTGLHQAFEHVRVLAAERGARVTGSEIVGLVPGAALVAAGLFYRGSESVGEAGSAPRDDVAAMNTAVDRLGLADLGPFDPRSKVIDLRLAKLSER